MLEGLFGNPTAQDVLLYLKNYGEGYPRQIATTFGYGLSRVQQQLKRLEDGGIVVSRNIGNVRLYALNPNWFFARELGALLEKALEALPPDTVQRFYRERRRPRKADKPLRRA